MNTPRPGSHCPTTPETCRLLPYCLNQYGFELNEALGTEPDDLRMLGGRGTGIKPRTVVDLTRMKPNSLRLLDRQFDNPSPELIGAEKGGNLAQSERGKTSEQRLSAEDGSSPKKISGKGRGILLDRVYTALCFFLPRKDCDNRKDRWLEWPRKYNDLKLTE